MPDIKTRDVVSGTIKAVDRSAMAGQRMKDVYVKAKDKTEHSVYSSESNSEEYAADRITDSASDVAREAVHQIDVTEHKLSAPEKLDRTLFVNRQGNPLTRAGATYILNKYVQMAELDTHVSPHILRHTKAMHLLEAGINIFYIKDLLGHEDISTTEVYAKASIETQRRALEKHSLVMPPATPSWVTNTDTLEWLKALGK